MLTKFCGAIRPSREGQESAGDEKIEENPEEQPVETPGRRGSHGESFIRERQKTDSAGLPDPFRTRVLMVLDGFLGEAMCRGSVRKESGDLKWLRVSPGGM
jgi:hypothetical protein